MKKTRRFHFFRSENQTLLALFSQKTKLVHKTLVQSNKNHQILLKNQEKNQFCQQTRKNGPKTSNLHAKTQNFYRRETPPIQYKICRRLENTRREFAAFTKM
jgi:hypothetical protein